MNLLALIIAGILILYGLYGIFKKKMIAPWTFSPKGRYMMDASRNKPFSKKPQAKNYFIYGTYAMIEGIILILIGIAVIFANL